jgi:hypothetical protein
VAFLWYADSNTILTTMYAASIPNTQCLVGMSGISKNTMTKLMHDGLVTQKTLRQVAAALHVDWTTLQKGHVYKHPRRQGNANNNCASEIMDTLAAFACLAAERTKLEFSDIRCLAYLYDTAEKTLKRLGAFTGNRAYDDTAIQIPCSPGPMQSEEEQWYIISRAFGENQYVCDNVDWNLAKARKFDSAKRIWPKLRGVAAHPMRPKNNDTPPRGIVCVDVADTVEQINWHDNRELQGILESLGAITYMIVSQHKIV